MPRSVDAGDEASRWNVHADSYVPAGATYSTEGFVIVKGYDHMCVWTGICIVKVVVLVVDSRPVVQEPSLVHKIIRVFVVGCF